MFLGSQSLGSVLKGSKTHLNNFRLFTPFFLRILGLHERFEEFDPGLRCLITIEGKEQDMTAREDGDTPGGRVSRCGGDSVLFRDFSAKGPADTMGLYVIASVLSKIE